MLNNRKVTAIITARTDSSRFPGKVLAELGGKPVLSYMIQRVRQSTIIDEIVLATTQKSGDANILKLANQVGVKKFAGSEEDVLERILGAAKKFNSDIIVYLTGDCPLIDPDIIDETVRLYIDSNADFSCNYLPERTFPNGVDVEVFSVRSLQKLDSELTEPWDREHLTGGFTENSNRYLCTGLIPRSEVKRPDIRITVDDPDDLQRLRLVVNELDDETSSFRTPDIIRFLDSHPEIKGDRLSYDPVFTAAVIGLGKAGSLYDFEPSNEIWSHAGAFNKAGRIRLVAGCDPDIEKREAFSKRWKCNQVFSTVEDLLSKVKPDIISVATPDDLHYPVVLKAVDAGVKAILCEKPISRSLQEAGEMVSLCNEKNISLVVNHWHRWADVYRNVRKFVVEEKGIGEIQHVLYWYTKGIFNSGSHVIDLLRWFFGDIAWVQANQTFDIDRPDPNLDGYLFFKAGFPCTLATVDWRKFIIADFDIIGTEGRVVVDNTGNVTLYRAEKWKRFYGEKTIGPSRFPYNSGIGKPMLNTAQEIYDILAKGGVASCTGEDSLASIKIIHALLNSYENNGKKVFC